MAGALTLQRADVQGFERIAWAEVLVPETPNVFGDYWSPEAIREAAYAFMKAGFGINVGIDVEHDNVDVSGSVKVVESFIVRPGDPDFIEGSWVVAVYIGDDALWQQVLDGEINGFSYEALVQFLPGLLTYTEPGWRSGVTEPDPTDGHTHEFLVQVDNVGRATTGGTSDTNGHMHTISGSTVTDEAAGHVHRFNIVQGKGGI